MKYKIGIDVGSTTVKMVVMNESDSVVWSRYERHNAQVRDVLQRYLAEVQDEFGRLGDWSSVSLGVTGSVGMQTAELLQAEFVQEVVAASAYARQKHPEAQALIDIGGEDSKVVLFSKGHTELRMNGNCAGGTGAFIDQMAALLGLSLDDINRLALQSTQRHTIAARCGVFAKTDVQNLASRHVPMTDICASIFHSIAVQTITTLAHGQRVEPPILLCGGPLTFLPALRRAFAEYMGIDESLFVVTGESNMVPAIGAALLAKESSRDMTKWDLCLQGTELQTPLSRASGKSPLFESSSDYEVWRQEKARNNIEVKPMRKGREQVVIGIDSGSTTTKIIAARQNGDILFSHYAPSLGNPVKAAGDGLAMLQEEAARQSTELEIVGSCSTGYGEELIKAAFNLDSGIIETMAHYLAARRLMPDVSFILDIGGQDMKAIFVEQGVVTRMELNEACSSGCGTFLQTFAQSLNRDISDFARQACTARHPCDLGTRCTVFMNSKIKQVLREGADISDIAAGLSYSVVNNCLFKVLKLKDVSELGQHIVVQGGTMRNDAVVRALELQTGCTVARSNMPEMMGAYGCALYAAEHPSVPHSLQATNRPTPQTTTLQCHGCENRCHITRYKFAGGRQASPTGGDGSANPPEHNTYVSGNKCERVFTNSGSGKERGLDIYTWKYRLLFDRKGLAEGRRIGLPRILNMYENYPFWHRLLSACGFQAVLSPESAMGRYEAELCSVMSDNICFPAKLVHSHVAALRQMGVERILMPYIVYEQQESATAVNSYNCPIVTGYSDVIRSAMPGEVPIDSPVLNFADTRLLRRQVTAWLLGLGVGRQTVRRAFSEAWTAQKQYEQAVSRRAREILDESRRQGRLTILLAGRPYHTDPLVQHRLSETIAAMGVNVISEDIVRNAPELPDGDTNIVRQWAYVNRIIKAAQWVSEQGDDVQFVQMTSFGCGPDAFIQDEVRSLLARHGKVYTLLKIDDVASVGSLKLRVRSLTESLRGTRATKGRKEALFTPPPSPTEQCTILVPHISEFITPLLPALSELAGYRVEILPPSNADSAALGLRYANNEVCYPATLVVGDIIRALQSGRYDLRRICACMAQTGGQCRATNYAGLLRRALVQAGFPDVPVVTFGVTTAIASQAGAQATSLKVSWWKIGPAVLLTMLYADSIAKMYYAAAVREVAPGQAAALRDRFLQSGADVLRQYDGRRHLTRELLRLVENAAQEFNQITRDVPTKRVGIVGEIFLKFNHFAHQHINEQLMKRGVEIVPPLFTMFFLQEFVNVPNNKRMGLYGTPFPTPLVRLLYALVKRNVKRFNRAGAAFRYFIPFDDIRQEAVCAEGIVSPAAQFGEGWLLPAEIGTFAEHGINNVLSLQPFGCIANHVVARGVENAIRRRYPDINLINLDFDSGVSDVNVTNRLLLFLS